MSSINWDNWHDALVRTQQVDMKALEIIEAVRRGEKVEDDLSRQSDLPARQGTTTRGAPEQSATAQSRCS
jgi:hypothetical protein